MDKDLSTSKTKLTASFSYNEKSNRKLVERAPPVESEVKAIISKLQVNLSSHIPRGQMGQRCKILFHFAM